MTCPFQKPNPVDLHDANHSVVDEAFERGRDWRFFASSDITGPSATGHPVSVTAPFDGSCFFINI